MQPQLKALVNNIFNCSGYPAYIIQDAALPIINEVIAALTVKHLETTVYDAPKIEEVRELIATTYVQALHATARVIIITNAQAMNASSANAMLKTLEEQKNKCFFILFTKNVRQLLPTIVSRAQVVKLDAEPEYQQEVTAVASDLLELWSQSGLTHEIALAEKWCKLYDVRSVTILWYCLQQLLVNQSLDDQQHASPILKKTSKLMPNKSLWAMFSKVQHALQIMARGITPNLQLLLEDLLIL